MLNDIDIATATKKARNAIARCCQLSMSVWVEQTQVPSALGPLSHMPRPPAHIQHSCVCTIIPSYHPGSKPPPQTVVTSKQCHNAPHPSASQGETSRLMALPYGMYQELNFPHQWRCSYHLLFCNPLLPRPPTPPGTQAWEVRIPERITARDTATPSTTFPFCA